MLLPITVNRQISQHYPPTVCVKDVASGHVVFRTVLNMTTRNVTADGWTRIDLQNSPLPASSTFDVAVTNAVVPTHRSGVTPDAAAWLTQTGVVGGAGRIETWGYVHAGVDGSSMDNNTCCTQAWSPADPPAADVVDRVSGIAAHAPTLASRLETGMVWQLGLANAASSPTTAPPATPVAAAAAAAGGAGLAETAALAPPTVTPTASSDTPESPPRFGVLVVPDAFHNGVPATGMSTCGASSMWDQIRMGWKSMYINVLFLASLDAWIEFEDAGVVSPLETLVGVPARTVRAQVADDIEAQFGYDNIDDSSASFPRKLKWFSRYGSKLPHLC